MKIAIFDLDKTLINADSGDLFANYLCEIGLIKDIDSFKEKVLYFENEYYEGRLDFLGYYQFAISQLVATKVPDLKKIVTKFVEDKITPVIYHQAHKVIEWHRSQGHVLLLISATIELLVEAIGKALGFESDNIISVQMETAGEYYTGNVIGEPSYEEGKVIRFQSWCQHHNIETSLIRTLFYSDSIHDLPLLSHVDQPVVVNPDQRLLQIAIDRNWPIIDMNHIELECLEIIHKNSPIN
ncbi:HAD-IB family hydrolase [Francisellaceae bacterium]|nr:HAD-IB family hydrolase [Francisellaceae bacterium]